MAEALLEQMSEGTIEAASAGSNPKPLHPHAVRVMKKRGIDISANRTKHLDEFLSQRFDVVITLCDRVREVCPEFPSHPDLVHWSVPDPALEGPNDRATLARVRAHRRRARDAHRVPAPSARQSIDEEVDTCRTMRLVNVRYMVDDVDESIAFYTKHARLRGLDERTARVRRRQAREPAPAARRAEELGGASDARRSHSPDRAAGTASTSSSTTSTPRSTRLRDAGATFRNDIVTGPGGKQILLEDPSGNVVELFQPAAR